MECEVALAELVRAEFETGHSYSTALLSWVMICLAVLIGCCEGRDDQSILCSVAWSCETMLVEQILVRKYNTLWDVDLDESAWRNKLPVDAVKYLLRAKWKQGLLVEHQLVITVEIYQIFGTGTCSWFMRRTRNKEPIINWLEEIQLARCLCISRYSLDLESWK